MATEDLANLDVDHPAVTLAKLQREAERRNERAEKEVVSCEACGTEVLKDDLEDALEAAETHDRKRHGGRRTAEVNGIAPPRDETAEAAENLVEELRDRDDENGGNSGGPMSETDRPEMTLRVTGGDPEVIEASLVDHPEVESVEIVDQNKAAAAFGENSGDGDA